MASVAEGKAAANARNLQLRASEVQSRAHRAEVTSILSKHPCAAADTVQFLHNKGFYADGPAADMPKSKWAVGLENREAKKRTARAEAAKEAAASADRIPTKYWTLGALSVRLLETRCLQKMDPMVFSNANLVSLKRSWEKDLVQTELLKLIEFLTGMSASFKLTEKLRDWRVFEQLLLKLHGDRCWKLSARSLPHVEEEFRGSNASFVRSLEHQLLLSTGARLTHFLPVRRVQSLKADQLRYFVPRQDPESGSVLERSCVKDRGSGVKEFEAPGQFRDSQRLFPTWHVFLDQGPVGWPAVNYLQQIVGLRMTITPDRLHRIVNCWKHALTLANLHLARAEMSIVLNVRSGPFKGAAFHQQLQSTCREMFFNLRPDNLLYQHLYDDICRDNAASEAADAIGSSEHQASLWQKLAEWMERAVKHVEAKQSRWFAWEYRASQFLRAEGGAHAFFLLLVYHGWRKKWWGTFASSPLAVHSGLSSKVAFEDKEEAEEEDAEGGEEEAAVQQQQQQSSSSNQQPPVSQAKARQEAGKKLTHHGQKLKYAAWALAVPGRISLMSVQVAVSRPLRRRVELEMELLKKRETCFELTQALHLCVDSNLIAEVWAELFAPELPGKLLCSHAGSGSHRVLQDVVTTAWILVCGLVAELTCNLWSSQLLLPHCLVGLVSASAETVTKCLRHLQRCWDVMERLEASSLANAECDKFVQSLPFWKDAFSREVMVILREHRFEVCPGFLQRQLREWASTFGGTLMVENAFKDMRASQRRSMSGKLQPESAWHLTFNSDLLPRLNFGHTPLPVPVTAAEVPKEPFGRELFERPVGAEDCSVGLQSLTDRRRGAWTSMTFEAWNSASVRWHAAMQCEGHWHRLERGWLSQLMPERCFAVHTPSQRAYVVLRSTQFGCIAWSAPLRVLQAKRDGRGYSLDGSRCTAGELQLVMIENLEDWLAYEATVELPKCEGGPLQMRLYGEKVPLYQHAARRAFSGTPLSCLRRLVALRGLEVASSGQSDVTKALISDALPELSQEEVRKLEEEPQNHSAVPAYDPVLDAEPLLGMF